MWNTATITALTSAVVAIAGAVAAIIHTLQHARSDKLHSGTGQDLTGGGYRP